MKNLILSILMFCGLYAYSQEIPYIITDCGDTLLAPNAFTPQSVNNTKFKPFVYSEKNYELSIYNRWGQLIYKGKEWDGRYNGKLSESGVYIWMVEITNNDCKSIYVSYVTLVK